MATDNINVAWVEAAKEITIKVLEKIPPDTVTEGRAVEIYKRIYKALREAHQ